MTTTSGLDDYDPVVYLYVLVGGARIKGEFLTPRKSIEGVIAPFVRKVRRLRATPLTAVV